MRDQRRGVAGGLGGRIGMLLRTFGGGTGISWFFEWELPWTIGGSLPVGPDQHLWCVGYQLPLIEASFDQARAV